MRFVAILAAIAATATLGTGCGDDPTGTLIVNYRLGAQDDTCAEYGVLNVRVTLDSPERSAIEATARCQNGGGAITINAVPVDSYTVIVEGLDPVDQVLWTAEETGVSVTEGGVEETRLIRLQPVLASIRVEWVFANGRMCPQNNVQDIEVGYYYLGTYTSDIYSCVVGEAVIPDLNGGSYDVRVRGIDMETEDYTYGVDINDVPVSAGQQTVLDYTTVVLDPCPADCVP
jgi:hypothetical protein